MDAPTRLHRRLGSSVAAAAMVLVSAACGDEPEAELSIESQLEAVAGRDLTPTEIARQIEIADTLCGMNDEVLAAVWEQLDATQLDFQDFVFGSHCPDRSVSYGLATGRTLTPEARVAAAEQEAEAPVSTVPLPDPASPLPPGDGRSAPSAPEPSIPIVIEEVGKEVVGADE